MPLLQRRRPPPPEDLVCRFRVWRAAQWHWKWECSFCYPPATGQRFGPLAWALIISRSMPRHFEHRHCHHQWLSVRLGRKLAA